MILILSTIHDSSTDRVIDWILRSKKEFLRFNDNETITFSFELSNSGFTIILKNKHHRINLSSVSSYWYRKGNFKLKWNFPTALKNSSIAHQLYINLSEEVKTVGDFIHYFLAEKPGLGNYLTAQPNKLYVLWKAQKNGLNIPLTYVSNDQKISTLLQSKQWISKGIWEALYLSISTHERIQIYTNEVQETANSTSFPSLYQEKIEKFVELRVFFLVDKCYSMAIFSQTDKQTATDFRQYNDGHPNRYVPFSLPKSIKKKLNRLMQELKLKTGSIDLILTPEMDYIFLEVNPVGQFGMVSHPCNYPIEKEIARYLTL